MRDTISYLQRRHVLSYVLSLPSAFHVLSRCGNGTETWTRHSTAATPEAGFADGDGTSARFDGPSGLAAAKDGTLFVADTNNHLVRHKYVPTPSTSGLIADKMRQT